MSINPIIAIGSLWEGEVSLAEAVREWGNCHYADIDDDGNVYVADPQAGHFLDADELQDLINWLQANYHTTAEK